MPIPILMPALSPTMEEGTLAKWLVKEGDTVTSGDVIAEIETDKATMEVEAVEEGTIGKILVDEGTANVAVNATIAVLLEEGEDADAIVDDGMTDEVDKLETAMAALPDRKPDEVPAKPAAVAQVTNGQAGRFFVSPLARRLAESGGIDLTQVQGSGPHGRIVKRDIEKVITDGVPAAAPAAAATSESTAVTTIAPAALPPALPDEEVLANYEAGSYDVVPHDNMRKTVARRLTQAKQTVPHFYLSIDCELDSLLAARQRVNALSPEDGPKRFKISVNDMIIKALALALQKVPAANATWTDEGMLLHRSSDIGVAVAVEGGLFVPVLRHVEIKSLSEISNEMRDLADRARKRRLAPHEYQGGTTAISNLGMFGITKFDAVINPPHATILAVGAGVKQPVVRGDEIVPRTIMGCTLSCDHRVVDGALGAELLNAFKGFIEEPVTMLV